MKTHRGGEHTRNTGRMAEVGHTTVDLQFLADRRQRQTQHTGRPEVVLRPRLQTAGVANKSRLFRSDAWQIERPHTKMKRAGMQATTFLAFLTATALAAEGINQFKNHPDTPRSPNELVSTKIMPQALPKPVRDRAKQLVQVLGPDYATNGVNVDTINGDRIITISPLGGNAVSACEKSEVMASKPNGQHVVATVAPTAKVEQVVDVVKPKTKTDAKALADIKPAPITDIAMSPAVNAGVYTVSAGNHSSKPNVTAGLVLGYANIDGSEVPFVLTGIQQNGEVVSGSDAEAAHMAGGAVVDKDGVVTGMLKNGARVRESDIESAFGIDLQATTADGWYTIASMVPLGQDTFHQAEPVVAPASC